MAIERHLRSRPGLVRAAHAIYPFAPGIASINREYHMQFIVLIYNDDALLGQLSQEEFNGTMRGCLGHADDLRKEGRLIESQILGPASSAKSVRVRNQRMTITDGPFSEAKEVIAGFNLIEADDMDEAVRIGATFPWARTGCIEIRPVADMAAIRKQVGAEV